MSRKVLGGLQSSSDRKWKEEWSSQSPNIPSKRVQGGHKVKGQGFLDGEPSCVPWGTPPPQHDPQSHHFHQELPITHLGLIPHCTHVLWQKQRASFSLVCLSFINLIPTSPCPPHQTFDWQLKMPNSAWNLAPSNSTGKAMLFKMKEE